MMKGEGGQSNIKCRIAEGQGFRHSLHRRPAPVFLWEIIAGDGSTAATRRSEGL
jgi:hypothetical protein